MCTAMFACMLMYLCFAASLWSPVWQRNVARVLRKKAIKNQNKGTCRMAFADGHIET